ncbi:MAG: L-threonylcarbamoyladenylate synthase [Armatimonadota bacterium]
MTGRPRVIAVPPASLEEAAAACAQVIADGELIVLPTDTVYGLGADPCNERAIARVYEVKGRPRAMALPVLVASQEDAARLVEGGTPAPVRALFSRFWPGPLTVVLARAAVLPAAVTAGGATVGLRVPASEVGRAIIAACGGALAVTSANVTAQPPAREVGELAPELVARVAVVVDAGRCPDGVPSTVVDLTVAPPRILRRGPVTAEQLRELLPDIVA